MAKSDDRSVPQGRARLLHDIEKPEGMPGSESSLYEAALETIQKALKSTSDLTTAKWVLEEYCGKASTSEVVALSDDTVIRAIAEILPKYLGDDKAERFLTELKDALAPPAS
jgi:hypothetical protein